MQMGGGDGDSAQGIKPPAPPRQSPASDERHVDPAQNQRFWQARADAMDRNDPRSVTLDRDSASSVAREVQRYQRWMFRHLERTGSSFDDVVDLGCGNGDWTVALAARARRLIAVDFTEPFLDLVRQRLAALALPAELEFVCADLAGYQFQRPADLVVAGAVLQYVGDAETAALLARIREALLPRRGALYLRATVSRWAARRAKQGDGYQAIYRSASWYLDQLARAGFTVDHHQVATDFVADELGRALLPGALWPLAALPVRAFRRSYRFFYRTDVLACVCHPKQ
jgi:SAM-dependent methyltransferase